MQELAKSWKDDLKQYPDHPQTLPLLRDRVENDPDKKVRKFAQNKSAKLENKKS
ncbi:hypothetical protein [Coleofasciculus sp.]|uniref:hypothetical protein n=1 Tax=Coleofasciculus sp. TaxID=3100458 RepID=UPI003A33C238